jgi:uroporphyrinogen decarboxylase
MRDRLQRALRGQPVDMVPIWLMRQAGRYLPGYRTLRARHSILEIARTPELAAEATLEPVRRFDVDAGVVFADITLPFAGLGIPFRIDPGVGPVIERPIRTPLDVERLGTFDAPAAVGFVAEAIRAFRREEPDRPIIGFAGAPFTLASYLIEGGASREYPETRRLLYQDPTTFDRLLDRLADVTVDYLLLQRRGGAHALQLFDTWAGLLTPDAFRLHVRPRLERIFRALADDGTTPTIYFSTASAHLLPQLARIGASALGVDWRLPLAEVRHRTGGVVALQGNLDPGALLGPTPAVQRAAQSVLDELPDRRAHVFNLGHGVLPTTDPDRIADLVAYVHEHGRADSSR